MSEDIFDGGWGYCCCWLLMIRYTIKHPTEQRAARMSIIPRLRNPTLWDARDITLNEPR